MRWGQRRIGRIVVDEVLADGDLLVRYDLSGRPPIRAILAFDPPESLRDGRSILSGLGRALDVSVEHGARGAGRFPLGVRSAREVEGAPPRFALDILAVRGDEVVVEMALGVVGSLVLHVPYVSDRWDLLYALADRWGYDIALGYVASRAA